MKKLISILLTVVFVVIINFNNNACTNFLITKGASVDGSTMISYAADSHVLYGELYHWPAMDWPAGTMLDVYEWDTGKLLGQIPQVAHTYNVIGNMNEFQVAIGETTYGGLKQLSSQKGAIMDYGSLMYIALQRSKTAREAVKIIGDLMAKYGYYSVGESFSISDANEVWIMEIIGKGEGEKGAVWVARLIPDGYICAHANQARITTFPLDDPENCIYASDVISFAKEKGLYEGKDKDFSFSDVYNPVDFGGARFCEIRVWAMFKDVNDDMQKHFEYAKGNVTHKKAHVEKTPVTKENYASNRMPLWIKPNRKISVQDMLNFMRDHLEGTELDMRKDIGAGPFEMPYRWRPLTWEATDADGKTHNYCNERATATQQTGFSFVAQARGWMPDKIGGIFWFSVDDAASSVYTPVYSSSTRLPETFARGNGKMMEWSDNSAFWIFNQVSNFAYTKYSYIHPEIDKKQQEFEANFVKKVKAIDAGAKQLFESDKELAIEFITDFSVNNANSLVYDWKKFYQYLFMKYMDGNVKKPNPGHQNPNLNQPGYSKDFYKNIIKETGDKFLMQGGGH
ncbi:MAG: C69 family dipeptidase [Bacteroidales bacterium]|nr:C69 family dipeptidase [Bacteroidales bacterium]